MPSKSRSQHNLMAAVANSPSFAQKTGISQSVGKEFFDADKRAGKFKPKASSKLPKGKSSGKRAGKGSRRP